MPELLLAFYIGEGRSEPLYIGTVASSLMCEFNHVLVASFSKRAGFVLKQHTLPSDSFAVRERRDLGGDGDWGGKRRREMTIRLAKLCISEPTVESFFKLPCT